VNAILSRFATRKEIGLAVGELEVAACVMAVTLAGRIEVGRFRLPYEHDGLAPALEQLLASCVTPEERTRCRVSVGVPALRVFFSARPIQAKHQDASPAALLHEVLQSPTLNIDDMIVDMIKHRLGRRTLACIISCRKRYFSMVLAALQAGGVQPARCEPAPCALLRHAARKYKPPRGARSLVRVFLGKGQGLAVLVTDGDLPLMWRPFGLPAGSEWDAISAAVASVRSPGVYCGLESDIDAVLVHGRPDLGGFPELASDPALEGLKTLRHEGPALDEGDIAFGLVLALSRRIEAFNLVRSFSGLTTFREVFPWAQVMFHTAALVAATLFLQHRLESHRNEAATARAGDAGFAWAARLPIQKLQEEKKNLEQRIESIRSFLASRSIWTNYTRDLSGRLPPELVMTSVVGNHGLETSGTNASGPKHSLVLNLNAPIPKTGTMPREIDAFLRSLRVDPLLKREFPDIELANLRRSYGPGKSSSVNFSVVCQPLKAAKPKPSAVGAAKGRAK
jgi:Tfp pilus assembly protein PilN